MKRISLSNLLPLLVVLVLTACTKSELTKYEQPDMVYIYKDYFSFTNDSTVYSFAIKANSLIQDTIRIPLRIMGVAKNTDRTVNVAVVADSTNAVANQHYVLLPATIKANEYKGNIEILVKRAADLQTAEVKLMVEIKESTDFKPGIPATTPMNPRAGGNLSYKVMLNDILTKPANWDTRLTSFFGTYSKVKYLFIINTTGRAEFPYGIAGGLSVNEMFYYNILLKTELANYVAANGPMLDENGIDVTFP